MKRFNWKNLSIFCLILFGMSMIISSCDDDEPTRTRIFGTITFDNVDTWTTWQDSGEVQLTIFPEFSLDPAAGWGAVPNAGTFAIGAPYNSQNPVILNYEAGKSSFDYEIELEPGSYSALAVGFRHDGVVDPSLKTATLGVHWGNPNEVSHGIKLSIPAGPILIEFDYPAPSEITITEGQELEINFKADFDFVNHWYN